MWVEVVVIALLLILNAFLAAIRVAVARVRRSQLKELAESNARARTILQWLDNREDHLATLQFWITLTGTAAAVVAGVKLTPHLIPVVTEWGVGPKWQIPLALLLVIVAMTALYLVICGLVPRKIANSRALPISLATAGVAGAATKLGWIPTKLLAGIAAIIALPFRNHNGNGNGETDEEEIDVVYHEGKLHDDLDDTERDLIASVIEFSDKTIRQTMTPRTDVVGIDFKMSQDAILRKISEEGYSRFPVYEGDLDHIKGVMHTRDVINMLVHSNLIILDDLVRPVKFVPDSKLISSLMQEFQNEQQHLAIVLDEFGGTAGLITMEDILEEIVGEIRDEHDVEVDPFILLTDNLCRVEASYPVEEFQKKFHVKLNDESNADTVAGYVVNSTGRLPQQGEKVVIGGLEFHITQVDGPRIERIRVKKLPEKSE